MLRVDKVTTATEKKRGVKNWVYSLDFNEKCPNVEYIVISLLGVGIVAIALSMTITAVLPWREAGKSSLVVSDFIERMFTSLLSFSRVIYAGAADGQLFSFLSRLHPTKRFPAASVVTIGGGLSGILHF